MQKAAEGMFLIWTLDAPGELQEALRQALLLPSDSKLLLDIGKIELEARHIISFANVSDAKRRAGGRIILTNPTGGTLRTITAMQLGEELVPVFASTKYAMMALAQ